MPNDDNDRPWRQVTIEFWTNEDPRRAAASFLPEPLRVLALPDVEPALEFTIDALSIYASLPNPFSNRVRSVPH